MVFSSLVFLWKFLPVLLAGHYLIGLCSAKIEYKNLFLLAGSLFFYAWGEPVYILLMLFSILLNWGVGLLIGGSPNRKKLWLTLGVLANLGLLGYFKYFGFLAGIVCRFLGGEFAIPQIALPIGISFFTFQSLSYLIDLYRGQYPPQKSLLRLALYISFFPQLIAGPIVQYKDIDSQLAHRSCTLEKTALGIRRFLYGLGKKVLIANVAAQCVDTIYGLPYADLTSPLAWLAAVLYSLQIYFDFSGYSDMAIGLGGIFGFEFRENFNYPYLSGSIQEFWQRWHISLGRWFRDYLYIPLGGNRRGGLRTYLNLLLVFFATGLWHGASFNFILWGLYHGFFQIVERLGFKKFLEKHRAFAHLYTLTVVLFGWVLFRAGTVTQALVICKRMLLPWRYLSGRYLLWELADAKTFAVALAGVLGCGVLQRFFEGKKPAARFKGSALELACCGLIFLLCICLLAGNTYNPFIYFRF